MLPYPIIIIQSKRVCIVSITLSIRVYYFFFIYIYLLFSIAAKCQIRRIDGSNRSDIGHWHCTHISISIHMWICCLRSAQMEWKKSFLNRPFVRFTVRVLDRQWFFYQARTLSLISDFILGFRKLRPFFFFLYYIFYGFFVLFWCLLLVETSSQ